MNYTDILIFAGQSNMQGQTGEKPEENQVVAGAMEYRFLTDSLIPLCDPVGEDIENGLLLAAHNGCGTIVPDFCRTYINKTARNIVAVHTARGSTTISEWLKGTARYECMIRKISAAIQKVERFSEVGKIYFVWLQGESDAIIGTSQAEYERMITNFKNQLKADLKINKFGIIQIGYFCRIVPWLEFSKNGEGIFRDEKIMTAQKHIPEVDKDFVMLTDICKKISMDSEYMNPNAGGHYNNKGMSVIGQKAGDTLGKIAAAEK